jgi:4-amino-4-deoxy-L-arabinose transferase-like glycosyltransferase
LFNPVSRLGVSLYSGLIFLGIAHCLYGLFAFPNPDEAYYWLWGQHPDWSYYDHPPFHAWVQGIFSAVFGHARWVLRLPTLLSNGLLLYAYYRLSRDLYGAQAGAAVWIIVACLLASPLYFTFLILAWPDQWLMAFSLVAAVGLIRFFDRYRLDGRGLSGDLYGAGLALGLAGLCKYTAVFVGLTGLGLIVCDLTLRPLLRDYRLYGAAAIAAFTLLPILIWNQQNDWLSLQYYLTRSIDSGGAGLHLKPLEVLGFWGFSLLLLSPVLSWALVQRLRYLPMGLTGARVPASSGGPSIDPVTAPSTYNAFAIGLFLVSTGSLSLIGLVSTALYYWNILAYLLLLPLLPSYFLRCRFSTDDLRTGKLPSPSWQRRRGFLLAQGLGCLAATLLLVNYCIFPIAAWFGPEGDPDGRMLFGWDTVGPAVQAALNTLPADALLLTTDYRSAASLAYALNNPQVLAISERRDQFDIWARRRSLAGKPALLLADDWHPLLPDLAQQFEQLTGPQTLSVRRWGGWIKNYYLYQGQGFQPSA